MLGKTASTRTHLSPHHLPMSGFVLKSDLSEAVHVEQIRAPVRAHAAAEVWSFQSPTSTLLRLLDDQRLPLLKTSSSVVGVRPRQFLPSEY